MSKWQAFLCDPLATDRRESVWTHVLNKCMNGQQQVTRIIYVIAWMCRQKEWRVQLKRLHWDTLIRSLVLYIRKITTGQPVSPFMDALDELLHFMWHQELATRIPVKTISALQSKMANVLHIYASMNVLVYLVSRFEASQWTRDLEDFASECQLAESLAQQDRQRDLIACCRATESALPFVPRSLCNIVVSFAC